MPSFRDGQSMTHTTEKPDVTLQLRVPSSTTSSLLPPWYWGVTVSVHGLDARIYQSLPLPAAHTGTTISIKPCEARLITEDTVPPGSEVPHSVRSPQHMAASPVIQSQCVTPGGTLRSTASNLFTMLRIRRIISTCIRGAEMKWLSLTVQINCSVFSGFAQNLPTSTPPLMWLTTVSVALQTFADTSLQHTQHPCDFPLRKALSRQSYNTHHYLLFPNFAAWCHQRSIKKNAKCFSKKHTKYWTGNLWDRLHPKWLGWHPYQAVPTLYFRDWSTFD